MATTNQMHNLTTLIKRCVTEFGWTKENSIISVLPGSSNPQIADDNPSLAQA
jgi:hypothetical protein